MRYPMIACALFSLAYLLTGGVLAAIGGHILLHGVAVIRGTELPLLGGAVQPKQPARDRLTPPAVPSDLTTVWR